MTSILLSCLIAIAAAASPTDAPTLSSDTLSLGEVTVTAIKQAADLRTQATALTVIGHKDAERNRVASARNGSEMVPNLFNRAGVKIYLQELLGCDVDVVRMRENMNPLFKQQILKYGIRVY